MPLVKPLQARLCLYAGNQISSTFIHALSHVSYAIDQDATLSNGQLVLGFLIQTRLINSFGFVVSCRKDID